MTGQWPHDFLQVTAQEWLFDLEVLGKQNTKAQDLAEFHLAVEQLKARRGTHDATRTETEADG